MHRHAPIRSARTHAAELSQKQKQLDAALASAQKAQTDANALQGQVASLQSQLTQAQQHASQSGAAPVGNAEATQAVLTLDDQLLNQANIYMQHTDEAEKAIRASDYSALASAFSEMQASKARWAALIQQRNQAVARLRG